MNACCGRLASMIKEGKTRGRAQKGKKRRSSSFPSLPVQLETAIRPPGPTSSLPQYLPVRGKDRPAYDAEVLPDTGQDGPRWLYSFTSVPLCHRISGASIAFPCGPRLKLYFCSPYCRPVA